MPSVTLQATGVYKNGPIDTFDRGLYSRDATAAVGVTVPLFNGGLTTSRIRQAIERNNADRITVETQRRGVLQTITQSWNQLLAARANIVSTDEQVRASTIAAEGTHQEEQVGLRSTLDVLNAEQELRAAQLSQVSAVHDEYTAAAAVLAAMGRLEARNLIPSEPLYDPKSNFRRLRVSWGWTPWEEPLGVLDRVVAYPTIPMSHDLAQEPSIAPGLPGAIKPTAVQKAPAAKAKPTKPRRAPTGLY
jgi:outer membrane protein